MSNLHSMTGYGAAGKSFGDRLIKVEIRSLNGKQSDVRCKLPMEYREKEVEIRNIILQRIYRGKVDVTITIMKNGAEEEYGINENLVKRYYNILSTLSDDMDLSKDRLLESILKIPNVVGVEENSFDEAEWSVLKSALEEVADTLMAFRKREGQSLYIELNNRISGILSCLSEVAKFEEERTVRIREKMLRSLNELMDFEQVDQNRFEQELIYYLEKLDVTEEKVRLKEHCDYFTTILNSENIEKGRKLGFIAQEIGREINTLGSKAQHAALQRLVVQMKDELEKIKEQSFNII